MPNINYSLSMRNNLLKKESKRAYPRLQMKEVISLEKFAEHIATHGCKYDRGDIYAVLYNAAKCLEELVMAGNKVSLGDLGSFYPSLVCEGSDTLEEFNVNKIKALTINWDKPEHLTYLPSDTTFSLVPARHQQAAILKNLNKLNPEKAQK